MKQWKAEEKKRKQRYYNGTAGTISAEDNAWQNDHTQRCERQA